MYRQSIQFPAKDAALREDVHALGAVVGNVVREQGGEAFFELVEGDRQAAILRAEGFALALGKIFEVAHTVDANTMRLQYLEALKQIGTSDATKIVVPMDLGDLVSNVAGRGNS